MERATRRRQRRRDKRAQNGIVGLSTIQQGFPDRFRTMMVFGNYQLLIPAAGNKAAHTFRGNSVYDPDFTGAGLTANTYSQLSLLYNRYRVLSSRIHLEYINQGTVPLIGVVSASISNALPNTDRTIGQRHTARGTMVPGGPNKWDHTASVATHAVFGVPKMQVLSEDDFAGLVGASPNNNWWWHVQVMNLNGAVAGSCLVVIRIEYQVVWSMPLDQAP